MNGKIIKNASWIIGCNILQSVVTLVIGMISARYLGPSNYGLINYANSIVAFVIPIMQLGLSKTLIQEFLDHPDKEGEVLGTAVVMNLCSGIFCILGVYIFLSAANKGEPETIAVGVLYSLSLLFQAVEIIKYWFQAKLMSKYPSIAALIAYTVVAAYKIFLLVTQKSVLWFAVTGSIDYIFISFLLIIIYKKLGNDRFSFSLDLGMKMLHRSKHYILSAMMVTVFQQTDRIMLKLMLNETETGFYSAAVTCAGITGFVYNAIIDSLRPPILEEKQKGSEHYEIGLIQLYTIITYLSLAQSVVMTVFAKPIVYILYGNQYLSSVTSLRIVVWYVTFAYYGTVRNIWILAEKKQKYLWIINLTGAVTNIILNAFLIPSLGAVGAAIASLTTQFFTNVIVVYLIKPIRYNNTLMLKGLNPKPLIDIIKLFMQQLKKRVH